MKYCSNCAAELGFSIPEGDNLPRYICTECDSIFYQNPKIVAGCLPFFGDKVLLCKRAIEPRKGYWTLPAGYMENGETTEEAAIRETLEETNAKVEVIKLYSLTSIIHVNQVQMLYLASMPEAVFSPTSESSEVQLFREEEIPWDEIAFPTMKSALGLYFKDRVEGEFPLREIRFERNKSTKGV